MFLMLGMIAASIAVIYSVQKFTDLLMERDKLRQPERELALLPEIIKAYADVTGDQGKAEELSALLAGIVRGRTNGLAERLERMEQSLDEIKGYLEREEEEEEDPLSPNELIRAIHNEHTKRVQALLDNMKTIGGIRPTHRELVVLLQVLRPSDASPSASSSSGRREHEPTDEAPSKEGTGEPPAEPATSAEEAPPTEPTT